MLLFKKAAHRAAGRTSSGGFAATFPVRGEGNTGCRPPFAENGPPDCFPGAPGPQNGEGLQSLPCRNPVSCLGYPSVRDLRKYIFRKR